jgi:hypothetical protein
MVLLMKRSLSPAYSFLPRPFAGLAALIVVAQAAQPALADLSFKPTYNKVQIAAADPSAKSVPVLPPLAAPPAATAPAISALSGKPPFPITGKFSRQVQRFTGLNWLGSTVASAGAGIYIHHKLGGKVKVKVKSYSLTDLLAGKVKSVSVNVKEPKLSGVGLGSVSIASSNPIWYAYRKAKNGDRGLKTPVIMIVNANLSQKQIAKALENPAVSSKLHGLKLDMPGVGEQQLEVLKPNVTIEDDVLKLQGTLITKGGTADSGVPVTIAAKPTLVGDHQIILDQMKINSPVIVEPEKFAAFTSKLLNPVVDFARMDRRDHAFRLDTLKVSGKDGDMEGHGRLLLVPKMRASGNQMAQTGTGIH